MDTACCCPSPDRDHFQLGSLSHLLNAKATGYQELPDWPEEAPDPSVRNVEVRGTGMGGWGTKGSPSDHPPTGRRPLPSRDRYGPAGRTLPGARVLCDPAHPSLFHCENRRTNPSVPSQVPEWTRCSSREKRKEKERPFYSDSEGESGPTESADSGEDALWWLVQEGGHGREVTEPVLSDPESDSESESESGSESESEKEEKEESSER